jgi:ketosteroid isomerase-like protein
MRRVVLLALAALALSCTEYEVDSAARVNADSHDFAAAVAAKNTDAVAAFCAEDVILSTADSLTVQGRVGVHRFLREYFASLEAFSVSTSHMHLSHAQDLAFEFGTYGIKVREAPLGDESGEGKYLVVWKKAKDNWYIAAVSFTDAKYSVPLPPGVRVYRGRPR